MVKKVVVSEVEMDQVTAYEGYLNQLAAAIVTLKAKINEMNLPGTVFMHPGYVEEVEDEIKNLEGKWTVVRSNRKKTVKEIKEAEREMPE